MSSQIKYYNCFGQEFREQILSCPEPHLWTTDYGVKGRVYHEIKERIEQQAKLIEQYFTTSHAVLDIGCGFGRQSYAMAQKGFPVTGTDTSAVFIQIAQELFQKHQLSGTFICTDITTDNSLSQFQQVLLLDVIEHIAPAKRKKFVQRMAALTNAKGRLILSLPHVKQRLSSRLNNQWRKRITQHFAFFRNREEHPYPIPQRQELLNLTAKHFNLLEQVTTSLTDYYVFEKRQ